jgi:hypothetical protein
LNLGETRISVALSKLKVVLVMTLSTAANVSAMLARFAGATAAVESVITKTTFNFDSATDILVSPRFNYQDGWFIKDAENKWVETDKPTDNRCFLDLQCNSD